MPTNTPVRNIHIRPRIVAAAAVNTQYLSLCTSHTHARTTQSCSVDGETTSKMRGNNQYANRPWAWCCCIYRYGLITATQMLNVPMMQLIYRLPPDLVLSVPRPSPFTDHSMGTCFPLMISFPL